MTLILKNIDRTAALVAGGFSLISTWPIMTGKLGYTSRNAFVNVAALTYTMFKHYWGNLGDIQPSAVVAGIPLPSVDELSYGISDRVLRYRANGGIFLAHQSGGNESLRIVGRAWGDKRFLFLNMLSLLFLWGNTKVIDVFKNQTSFFPPLNFPKSSPSARGGIAAKRLREIDKDPWLPFNKSNLNVGYQEQHMTFPVVSKNRVYISMYIETFSWRQRLDKDGRKMVEYTLFFRKYEPQAEYEFGEFYVPSRGGLGSPKLIKVYKEKTVNKPLIYAAWKSITEITATLSINPELFNIDNFSNFGHQFVMNYFGVNIDHDDRIPGILEQRGGFF